MNGSYIFYFFYDPFHTHPAQVGQGVFSWLLGHGFLSGNFGSAFGLLFGSLFGLRGFLGLEIDQFADLERGKVPDANGGGQGMVEPGVADFVAQAAQFLLQGEQSL